MKLILGESSNATLFRSEEGGSDDEDSDGEEEDADFESAANLQYLRLGRLQVISGVVTHILRYDQGIVRQSSPTRRAERRSPKMRMRVVMKGQIRRRQNHLSSLTHPTLGQPSGGRMNLAQKRTRPFNEVSRRIYEWMMSCWNSKRYGWPTMRI